jgi:ABC-type antimicrobial peptide transport system permease subunit
MYQASPPPTSGTNFVIRSARGAAAALAPGVVSAIANLDPALSLTARPVSDYANAAVAKERIVAMLSGFFGVLALVLAGIGVFGVTAHGVQGRRAEIGLRIALGASSGGVMRLVLGRVTLLIALGIAVGGAASFWASRLVGSLLFGIEPRDPATFVSAVLVLAVIGVAAGAVPAWRAARVDPTTVMRSL